MAVPPELSGHLNLDGPPVTPRPSATVLLIRNGEPWELLLVHRPGGADFAPGAYVFPGGTVHEHDRMFDDEIRAAAVRELFEEAGILLASGAGDAECAKVRDLVAEGTSFGDALMQLGLTPAFDELIMFARWVTPAQLRRRFDARFYLAPLPTRQSVRPPGRGHRLEVDLTRSSAGQPAHHAGLCDAGGARVGRRRAGHRDAFRACKALEGDSDHRAAHCPDRAGLGDRPGLAPLKRVKGASCAKRT